MVRPKFKSRPGGAKSTTSSIAEPSTKPIEFEVLDVTKSDERPDQDSVTSNTKSTTISISAGPSTSSQPSETVLTTVTESVTQSDNDSQSSTLFERSATTLFGRANLIGQSVITDTSHASQSVITTDSSHVSQSVTPVNSQSVTAERVSDNLLSSSSTTNQHVFAVPANPSSSSTVFDLDLKITRTVANAEEEGGKSCDILFVDEVADGGLPDDLVDVQTNQKPSSHRKSSKRRVVNVLPEEGEISDNEEDDLESQDIPSTSTSSDMESKLRAKLIQTMKAQNKLPPDETEHLKSTDKKKKKSKSKKSSRASSVMSKKSSRSVIITGDVGEEKKKSKKKKKDSKHDKEDIIHSDATSSSEKKKKKKSKKHDKDGKKSSKSDEKRSKSSSSRRSHSRNGTGEHGEYDTSYDDYEARGRDFDGIDDQPVRAMNSVIGVVASSIHRRPPTPPRYDDFDDGWHHRSRSPTGSHGRSAGGGGFRDRSPGFASGSRRGSGRRGGSSTGGNTEPLGARRRLGGSVAAEEDRPYAHTGAGPSRGRGRGRGGRGAYTGYDYHSRSRSRSPVDRAKSAERRPSPPRDMPEHIRWLHDRWRKYDSSFFKGKQSRDSMQSMDCTMVNRRHYTGNCIETEEAKTLRDYFIPTPGEAEDHRKKREENRRRQLREMREDRGGRRRFTEHDNRASGSRAGTSESASKAYQQQWRRGGIHQHDIGRILTFKEWCLSAQEDYKDHDTALDAYNDYKLEYRRRSLAKFFQAHSEEEWFLEKYHPMLKQEREARRKFKVDRRLDAFMQLLVRGWMEVSLDVIESRKVRKLIDAMIVILEGGDEGDLGMLNELDYVLEEKKEESFVVGEKAECDSDSDEEKEPEPPKMDKDGNPIAGKAPGGVGRTHQEQALDEELKEMGLVTADENGMVSAMDLEAMQHAKDYSLYIQQHEQAGRHAADLPDNLNNTEEVRETSKLASGVFLSQITQLANTKNLQEMNLHRASSVLIRNLAPTVTRNEIEELLADCHGGFLRVRLLPPDPTANWTRQAIATFWHNANLTKIIWKLRGVELKGTQIQVIEWREFKRRIDVADGLAGDKSVVLRDIQLCKSLIEHLDRRCQLWGSSEQTNQDDIEPGEASEGKPSANPLLINLDECLAFHLHQLMKTKSTGQDGDKSKQQPDANKDLIDRDQNLTRVLDRLVLYLRLVHSVDYYGCLWHEFEDDEPRRISTMTLRNEPKKNATPKRLAKYIRAFEDRLKDLLPHEKRLADEHVEVLGKRNNELEIEKFCENNLLSIPDGMSKCCLCYKRFTTRQFAKMHVQEKHDDKIEEVKWIVLCFNNFLSDPTRPCNVELPGNEPVKDEPKS